MRMMIKSLSEIDLRDFALQHVLQGGIAAHAHNIRCAFVSNIKGFC
tara:strand:- start:510 stop:647 length:138 start_codon:yes stop_codon:yes gene_type:complete